MEFMNDTKPRNLVYSYLGASLSILKNYTFIGYILGNQCSITKLDIMLFIFLINDPSQLHVYLKTISPATLQSEREDEQPSMIWNFRE
jgi:hypothetical protein